MTEYGLPPLPLFEPDQYGYPVPSVSADRRRTLRNEARIRSGIHPVRRIPLLEPAGPTCGDCAHLFAQETSPRRRFFKCGLGPISSGPATDIRKRWPACEDHQPRPPEET